MKEKKEDKKERGFRIPRRRCVNGQSVVDVAVRVLIFLGHFRSWKFGLFVGWTQTSGCHYPLMQRHVPAEWNIQIHGRKNHSTWRTCTRTTIWKPLGGTAGHRGHMHPGARAKNTGLATHCLQLVFVRFLRV
jgi:hypothetical protein